MKSAIDGCGFFISFSQKYGRRHSLRAFFLCVSYFDCKTNSQILGKNGVLPFEIFIFDILSVIFGSNFLCYAICFWKKVIGDGKKL